MESPNPQTLKLLDACIGRRFKQIRVFLNHTQEETGKLLGVSFQQTQKYEKGKTRLSASRLYLLSKIWNIPIDTFFKNLDTDLD